MDEWKSKGLCTIQGLKIISYHYFDKLMDLSTSLKRIQLLKQGLSFCSVDLASYFSSCHGAAKIRNWRVYSSFLLRLPPQKLPAEKRFQFDSLMQTI